MCKYCERRKDLKFGWEQPRLKRAGNVVDELNIEVVIHDYQAAQPQLILTSKEFFPLIGAGEGVATCYIPINYCPSCGRKLGKARE